MIPAFGLGATAAALLAASASYDVGVRTELRAASDPFGLAALDGAQEVDPRAAVLLKGAGVRLSAVYNPRIYWLEPQQTPSPASTPNVLHRAEVQLERTWDRGGRLFALEDAAYGTNDFSPLAGTGGAPTSVTGAGAPVPLSTLPRVLLAQYVLTSTTLGTQAPLGNFFRLGGSAQYVVSGGPDLVSRLDIPLQRGPRADLSLSYAPTRQDSFTTSVEGLHSNFSSGQRAQLLQVSESWRGQWSRVTDVGLTVGGALVENQGAVGVSMLDRFPVAGASLNTQVPFYGMHSAARLALTFGPYLDVYAADVYERVEADASLAFDLYRWDVRVALRGTRFLTGWQRRGETLVVAEVTLAHVLTPGLKLEGGTRAFWQNGAAVTDAPLQGALFLSLSGAQAGPLGR